MGIVIESGLNPPS